MATVHAVKMARLTQASDNEPLMKLERPTTGCSQSTAHLINAAFTDILSARPHNPKAVNNLAVSKRGESDYHDKFVDQLTKVSEQYTERLTVLSNLEKHLVQARAKGLADDEKSITSKTALCSTYAELNLPKGPSQFRKYLNEELLSRHNLLVPSKFLPAEPKQYEPPQDSPPLYLSPTITASNHSHKGLTLSNDTKTENLPQKPIWQDTLLPEDRELEKAGLTNFYRKANYLRNSRYSKTKWSNTASSGPIKMKQIVCLKEGECVSFVAEPEEVQFTDYSVGKTYESTLELKNVSAVSRQLRLVPLKSDHFKVTLLACPTADGVIAPGLCASYRVLFTPDSLSNYQAELKFTTCNDEEITVHLVGLRPPPILNIPDVLETGYCLVGGRKTTVLECANTGGEGAFSLHHLDNTSDQQLPVKNEIVLGPFSISPSRFHLAANNGIVPLSISFTPDKGVGEYSQQFNIACDNGQIMGFTVRGVAQSVSVGCVCVGEPSSPELIDDSLPQTTVVNPVLTVPTVNPHSTSSGSVFIKNFGNVELMFHWRFYRPITEAPLWKTTHEDKPYIDKLVPSHDTPFSVDPPNGHLHSKETKKFTFHFSPCKANYYVDMAHLVLTGIDSNEPLDTSQEEYEWLRLSASEVIITCVKLSGVAQEFDVDVRPPALLIPYKLPLATETKKQVKLRNHSLSAVCYQWSKYQCDTVVIRVDPAHGRIDPGECIDLQVCIHSIEKGSFSCTLLCELDNSERTTALPISGKFEGPVVSVSSPCLEFGLVPVGRVNSLSFKIISHTNCALYYSLKQLTDEHRGHFINIPCLSFSPSEGELGPNGSATVSVECGSPGVIGRLKTIIEVLINGQPAQHFWAQANLQRPRVVMLPTNVHIEKAYVGIESSREVVLTNDSPVPAQFTWSSLVAGKNVRVAVNPMTGRIAPQQSTTISIKVSWTETKDEAEAILRLEVFDMEKPIFLLLSAQVLGLSVSFSNPFSVDFGASNELGVPVSRTLTVTNTSGIPATLDNRVVLYASAATPNPPTLPKPEENVRKNKRKALLGPTSGKSSKQSTLEHRSLLLREGHGCCFAVDPLSTTLPPFSTVSVTLTAHSDMWGHYTDHLVCKVPGLEDSIVPIDYGVVGCPIVFLSTATVGHTLARLGSHAPGAQTVRRVLKIKNNSPVAIRVNWQMFNILQNDDKYVDLVMAIGDPFPRDDSVLGSTTHRKTDRPSSRGYNTGLVSKSESFFLPSERSEISDNFISHCDSKLDSMFSDVGEDEPMKIITAFIKPHEGVQSTYPFDIHPKQIVLPGHGVTAVEVTFHPSIEGLNLMGPQLASYALGYMSLDGECPESIMRKSLYDVEPLRIDVIAEIEHNRLSLECSNDDGLKFAYPASVLLQDGQIIGERYRVLTHHFTLHNPKPTLAEFTLSTHSEKFKVSNIHSNKEAPNNSDYISLQSGQSVSFDISFTLHLEDLQQTNNQDTCIFTDSLQVTYSTGALQEFSLTATTSLPQLTLSTNRLDFNTTYVDGQPAMATLMVSNYSLSDALWSLTVSSDIQEVVSVCPESGLMPLHMSRGTVSNKLIQVEFSPRSEQVYRGRVYLNEALTNREMMVIVKGQGSVDQKYIRR